MAILVVLGVAGELGLHVRSSQIVAKIRGIQHEIDNAQRKTIAEITNNLPKLQNVRLRRNREPPKPARKWPKPMKLLQKPMSEQLN